ncbi:hypothetical protein P7C73_g3204, partial [Tremellales sp. Uapishka_1]
MDPPRRVHGYAEASEAESSRNGWSGAEWPRPSISSSEDRPYVLKIADTAPSPTTEQYNFPRARRKSHSQLPKTTPTESEEEAMSSASLKVKKGKRGRTSSFTYLPFHRRRSTHSGSPSRGSWKRWGTALVLLLTLLWGLHRLWRRYEIQLEFAVFSRSWVRQEMDSVSPLKGCFDAPNLSPEYNLSQLHAPKHQMLSPGISLRKGMSCYDFAATIQPIPDLPAQYLIYHTYWRSDLLPFTDRQTATLLAFLATQPLTHSKLILWTNGADVLGENMYLKPILETWGNYIELRQADLKVLSRGTEVEELFGGNIVFDKRGWVDGDAVRLLVLWHYGGVWLDMDQILTRDLHPLTESEFVTQWDCYGTLSLSLNGLFPDTGADKPYFQLNGALMHFQASSPYLCEFFHLMKTEPLPQPNTFSWGSHLYSKLHRRLLAAHVKPFAVLPWCFADPRNCRSDIRFPDPFTPDPAAWGGQRWDEGGRELLEERVGAVWSIHLHNQWEKKFPSGGWIERLLDGYKAQVELLEGWARGRNGDAGMVHLKRAFVEATASEV